MYDPVIIAEGLFAIATVLDFTRFAAFLPAFKALGTLQISFAIMLKVCLMPMTVARLNVKLDHRVLKCAINNIDSS